MTSLEERCNLLRSGLQLLLKNRSITFVELLPGSKKQGWKYNVTSELCRIKAIKMVGAGNKYEYLLTNQEFISELVDDPQKLAFFVSTSRKKPKLTPQSVALTDRQMAVTAMIKEMLVHGPVRTAKIRKAVTAAGYTYGMMRKARDILGLEAFRHGFGESSYSTWEFGLPRNTENGIPSVAIPAALAAPVPGPYINIGQPDVALTESVPETNEVNELLLRLMGGMIDKMDRIERQNIKILDILKELM